MGVFTTARDYRSVENPYTSVIPSLSYDFNKPSKKFFTGWLKDPMSQAGLGQFAQEEGTAYEQIRRRPTLQSGFSRDAVNDYLFQKARQDIGGRRQGYVGQMQQFAAGSLMNMWDQRNKFNLDKYRTAAGLYNDAIRDYTPTASPLTGLIGQGIQAAGQAAAGYAGRHP